ncbi:MAG: cell filamentation protein Fic [Elusimicrobia bacterium RIFOXYA2_FULL_50_26]|nr:MAG: cell filamentation protein Fic [Elusimicrobia bacterium RIFOXYA2_FULL_50_26]OGS23778.1 MAG: cell filamentation protein Fic [Elusimicrobia bacterium RIFOXYB2_FULL_50_12]
MNPLNYKNRIKEIDEQQKRINAYRPLSKEALKQLKEYYRIGLTYSSNAIEGNSLTETETKIVIEEGITIGGKPLKDHYEAVGHSEAYDLLYKLSQGKEITEEAILHLHKLFYHRIDEDNAGAYRKVNVIITGTDFTPPHHSKVPELMKKLAKNIPAMRKKYHPVEFAALLHNKFVEIHPFVDGNGRAARLLLNLALLQAGYAITIIPPVLRRDYIAALQKANKGNNTPFVDFISNMVYESQREYIRLMEALKE